MAACITDRCRQGRRDCPTPATCSMTPSAYMVREARLAVAAHDAGDMPRYELHRCNARRIADHLARQDSLQPPRPLVPISTDYGIERPEQDRFVTQDGLFEAAFLACRWALFAIACGCGLMAWRHFFS